MSSENVDEVRKFKFKVVLLGEGAVGKSSMVLRYVENKFTTRHLSTIQASYQSRTINVDDCEVELNIWDTAGQEKYHSLGPIYYRGSNGVLLVYDITDQRSFEKVKMWLKEIKLALGDTADILIIGNKLDLEDQRTVSRQDAEEYAHSENVLYAETSAMENVGICEAFEQLATEMIEKWRHRAIHTPAQPTRSIQLVDEADIQQNRKKCC